MKPGTARREMRRLVTEHLTGNAAGEPRHDLVLELEHIGESSVPTISEIEKRQDRDRHTHLRVAYAVGHVAE